MSADGSLDIRDGGVIAVDTDRLRSAAAELRALSVPCDALLLGLEQMTHELADHPATAWPVVPVAGGLARLLREARDEASALADTLTGIADVYEIVELEAARRAAAGGDPRVGRFLRGRLVDARERSPDAAARADLLLATWTLLGPAELQRQIGGAGAPFGLLGGAAVAATGLTLAAVGALGLGRAQAAGASGFAGLAGGGPGVSAPLEIVRSASPTTPSPTTIAALAERVPRAEDQLRVERYERAGGGSRFAVYVAGTRSPLGFGGVEPFDMASNVRLYTGRASASYEAVVAALRAAGARPGDTVLAVGYSQGGAVTSRLALDGPFRVVGNVTFGSPVQADPGERVLEVTVRHTDDPVPALQSGGHPDRAGAPGSIVVERVADPAPSVTDLALGAHAIDAYGETAALADASGDPRVDDIHERLEEFLGAEPAEVTTYRVRRPG
ncbi:hypothetical protein [Microbacterium sp. cf332]|uniref:hypothetical protein n=1 Tax=Microbacterium sp. cf332 TaxID=1761804 RepID=UPI00087FEC3D|nr:hypothetical protein [Microbacterium sp. cf332]SDQ51619.1 hypothetical protein SAMN04487847_1688 [Microbacterium sp. cf332]